MSVLIKGMEMPKCCDVCTFGEWSNLHQTACCKLLEYEACFEDFSQEYKMARSEHCPLVEIPPHGRLVDADALIALVSDSTILGDGFKQAFCALVTGEPTVIEAEEDYEN